MFCPKCGANIPDGARFCPRCGSSAPVRPSVKVTPLDSQGMPLPEEVPFPPLAAPRAADPQLSTPAGQAASLDGAQGQQGPVNYLPPLRQQPYVGKAPAQGARPVPTVGMPQAGYVLGALDVICSVLLLLAPWVTLDLGSFGNKAWSLPALGMQFFDQQGALMQYAGISLEDSPALTIAGLICFIFCLLPQLGLIPAALADFKGKRDSILGAVLTVICCLLSFAVLSLVVAAMNDEMGGYVDLSSVLHVTIWCWITLAVAVISMVARKAMRG